MACIGGILLYVSTAMVKPAEVKQVLAHNAFHISLMVYTAVVVVLTDFLIGVVSAIIIWGCPVSLLRQTGAGAGTTGGSELNRRKDPQ